MGEEEETKLISLQDLLKSGISRKFLIRKELTKISQKMTFIIYFYSNADYNVKFIERIKMTQKHWGNSCEIFSSDLIKTAMVSSIRYESYRMSTA